MVENYMDYSNGACQNTYTEGQKDAMNAVLGGTRSNIWSAGNLNDTGVLLGETPCAPKAFFYADSKVVCTGEQLTLTDNSYNGTVTTYSWDLPGATPNTSSAQNPNVVYNSPGVYSVTLNVSNAQGSDSYSRTDYITVIPSTAQETSWFSFEGFEETQEDYLLIPDDFGNAWEETNTSFTGNRGIYIKNNSGNPVGSIDEFQLPSVDMTGINDPDLYFRLSYKQKSGTSDKLRVYVSDNCGQSWNMRYNKSGSSLATVSGTTNSSFTPSSAADWELIEVNLAAFASEEHVLVKFQCTSDAGNNIYIDDIQISGPLGIGNEALDFSFAVSPNPMLDRATILLTAENNDRYRIAVNDVTGKLVTTVVNGELSAGKHQYELDGTQLNAGIYFVSVETAAGRSVKKLVVQ
jgi:PKD repeat protein